MIFLLPLLLMLPAQAGISPRMYANEYCWSLKLGSDEKAAHEAAMLIAEDPDGVDYTLEAVADEVKEYCAFIFGEENRYD